MATSLLSLTNGESINYFEFGHENINKKPTLFFVHGNLINWTCWTDTINHLKNFDFHIIAVDLRGFGDSTYHKPCSLLGDWAGDLVDFCNIKKINHCVPIGWSFGGAISMKFAELAPNIVTKIILTCSCPYDGVSFSTTEVPCKTFEEVKANQLVVFIESILAAGR
jgi:2-hydroxy-6-oxonona-2,4-dienedioate hydrolase